MENLNLQELADINGNGGPIANTLLATGGAIAAGNAIAIGALTAPIWGGVAAGLGAYAIYKAID